MYGTWYQVPGSWFRVPGTRYLLFGIPRRACPTKAKCNPNIKALHTGCRRPGHASQKHCSITLDPCALTLGSAVSLIFLRGLIWMSGNYILKNAPWEPRAPDLEVNSLTL